MELHGCKSPRVKPRADIRGRPAENPPRHAESNMTIWTPGFAGPVVRVRPPPPAQVVPPLPGLLVDAAPPLPRLCHLCPGFSSTLPHPCPGCPTSARVTRRRCPTPAQVVPPLPGLLCSLPVVLVFAHPIAWARTSNPGKGGTPACGNPGAPPPAPRTPHPAPRLAGSRPPSPPSRSPLRRPSPGMCPKGRIRRPTHAPWLPNSTFRAPATTGIRAVPSSDAAMTD